MLGNVVFILFWEDFCPAKNGDSNTTEKKGDQILGNSGGLFHRWPYREEEVGRKTQTAPQISSDFI